MKLLFAFCTSLLLLSCDVNSTPNDQVDEKEIENNTYHNDELGWTIEIPDDYSINSQEQTDKNTEDGSYLLDHLSGVEVGSSNVDVLLAFQKGLNIFASTAEPWAGDGKTWAEYNAQQKDSLVEAFQSQEVLSTDISATKIVNIDGIDFQEFTIYSYYSDTYDTHGLYTTDDSPISKQVMYSSFINGYDFTVSIFYENEKEKNTMIAAWMNSKFE